MKRQCSTIINNEGGATLIITVELTGRHALYVDDTNTMETIYYTKNPY
jgi:hypothetical protein